MVCVELRVSRYYRTTPSSLLSALRAQYNTLRIHIISLQHGWLLYFVLDVALHRYMPCGSWTFHVRISTAILLLFSTEKKNVNGKKICIAVAQMSRRPTHTCVRGRLTAPHRLIGPQLIIHGHACLPTWVTHNSIFLIGKRRSFVYTVRAFKLCKTCVL